MLDFNQLAQKWQKKWEEHQVFQPEINPKKPKFFLNFPYPYVNGYLHLGHSYTLLRVEALARYKRMKGFNVLFPQGWHATGSPIINAAKRIAEHEPKQVKIMKEMGFSEAEIKKFVDPKYWVEYFAPENKKDLTNLGLSIDWRREFFTTELNPHYDKFVRWQFNKLKEKNYVIKSKFPVVWCPKDNTIVQDHSRTEGEGEVPQEFCLVKHKLEDDTYIVTATLRQDTILGITNLYLNPEVEYAKIEVNKEKWIVGKPIIPKLKNQDYEIKEISTLMGKDLVGKKVEVFGGRQILVLPAKFLDPEFGTGIVHSVPSDSADDLISLYDLQKDEPTLKKYNLNPKEVKSITPIAVLNTPGYGRIPAEEFLKRYHVNSQHEKDKLEKIKKELYKLSYYEASFNSLYKNVFSKNLENVPVQQGKELIKKELLEKGIIEIYYQLTGKVVCRCLTPSIVKIVSDQWFIDYGNKEWKKLAHRALNDLKLYPEKARVQFDYVLDWLKPWACTHEEGLGTKLPWDEKWLIESLSDSTIYMAYYTIAHLIKEIDPKGLDDSCFNYIFLNKGNKPKINNIDKLKAEFAYWYPVDFRNSGKDLIQNHLSFFIFNHTAIFPEKYWPKGIGVNGWVTIDGQKMSKSRGNFITIREAINKYSADITRLTMLSGGEEMDDPNWDSSLAGSLKTKLTQLHDFWIENYHKGSLQYGRREKLLESEINLIIKEASQAMEETKFRTALQKSYFEMQKILKAYLKKVETPNKKLISLYIETQIKLLAPFIPFLCEESWHKIGYKSFVALAAWPKCDETKIDLEATASEQLVQEVIFDITKVLELIKKDKLKKITLIVAADWKFKFAKKIQEALISTRDVKQLMKTLLPEFKEHGQELSKLIPAIVKDLGKLPEIVLTQNKERQILTEAKAEISEQFSCQVEIIKAEQSSQPKALAALPGKVGVLIS